MQQYASGVIRLAKMYVTVAIRGDESKELSVSIAFVAAVVISHGQALHEPNPQ